MKRSKPLTRTSGPATLTIKPKACKVCREDFFPVRPMQLVCSPKCGMDYARKVTEGQAKERRRTEAQADRAKREAMKTLPELKAEAQQAFNAYIRARDADKPCICCGKPLLLVVFEDEEGRELLQHTTGGGYDCGHYRSVGSADHLRYDERNAHAQRKQCNRWGSGRAVDYRIGLIQRLGLEAVEALEADNAPRKWTREELREIRATYRAKLKALKATA